MRPWIQERVVNPLTGLLRSGATPQRLAWSLAAGIVIGINPLLGSTTLIALGLAAAFRLNIVASQLANHAAYPLELLLLPFFIKLGARIFGTPGLPPGPRAMIHAVKEHPLRATHALWTWEWHALVVWAVVAAIATPAIAFLLRPALEKLHARVHRNQPAQA